MKQILLATLSVCIVLIISSFTVKQDNPDGNGGRWENREGTGNNQVQ